VDVLWTVAEPGGPRPPAHANSCYLDRDVKLLDRYIIRETLTPFLFALGVFTFLFAVQPALEKAQNLLAKGVDLGTVGFLLLTLLPQALGLALPMAFLAGLLMGLGRLSGDREAVALLACGVSPLRLLRPVMGLAVVVAAANMYVLMELIPDSNQAFRVRTTQFLATQSESDIEPGVFYGGFPGKMLRVWERRPGGGWNGVILADTSEPGRPVLTLAPVGHLEVNEAARQVAIVLPGESMRYVPGSEPGVYDTARARDLRFAIPAESVFGDGSIIQRGNREMRIPELRALEEQKKAIGLSPHPEIIQRHQMFAFPVACLVFALIGLALGVNSRKEGKYGGFTMGLAVIFAYYGIMVYFESRTKGGLFPAEWARWMPNIVLGVIGLLAVRWRLRAVGGDLAIRLPGWLARGVARRTEGPSAARVVVVIRLPDLRLPRPRLLDLYVSRRYLSVIGLSFAAMLGLYYIGTVIDKSERLFKGQADGWMLVQFLYYSTPQFLAYVIPMAILFAVLATVGGLTRTGELVVMRSCGISLYRAAVPLFALALVWSGGLFFLEDRVLARANRRAEALDARIRSGELPVIEPVTTTNWLVDTRGRIYHFALFEPLRQTMHSVSVFEVAPSASRLSSHTWAARAVFGGGQWRGERGWVQRFPRSGEATRETFAARRLDLDPPDRFPALQNQDADMMSFGELRQHVLERAAQGQTLVESRLTLQERIAFPVAAMVMTLLGVPFGATTGRRGSLYGIGLALVLGVGYWLVNTFFLAVGEAALMPAALAAWAANLFFLTLAAYMTLTIRT
jgi:LPS export ABC transporter permease LptG/LPS export ABC transporter permease LptF